MSVSVKISPYRELLMIVHFFLIIYYTIDESQLHVNVYGITSIIDIDETKKLLKRRETDRSISKH